MTAELFWLNFLYNILATVIGGSMLTLLFFGLREKAFPLPDITGRWHIEMHTVNSSYNPYKGMVLRYVAMLWREGNRIEGTVEKVYENSSKGERKYIGKNRTRGLAVGYIEKNIFPKIELYYMLLKMVMDESQLISMNLSSVPKKK